MNIVEDYVNPSAHIPMSVLPALAPISTDLAQKITDNQSTNLYLLAKTKNATEIRAGVARERECIIVIATAKVVLMARNS